MSSGYLVVILPRVAAHSCQWDPIGHRGSIGMSILGSGHYSFLCSLGIVWEFENFSRVMLNFTSSTNIVGNVPSCLVTTGKDLLKMLQDGSRSSQFLELRGVRAELSEGGQVKGAPLGPKGWVGLGNPLLRLLV